MTWARIRNVLRWVVGEMISHAPGRVAASVVLCGLLTASEGAGVLLMPELLALVGVMEENPLPRMSGWLARALSVAHVEPTLGVVLGLFVALSVTRAVASRLVARVAAALREGIVDAHRLRLYRAIADAQWTYLVTRPPTAFQHILTGEISRLGWAVTQIIEIAVVSLTVVVYVALALRLSPVMAVLVLACAATLGWLMRGGLDRAGELGGEAASARYRLHAALASHLASMKTARSFGALGRHDREFADASRALSQVTAAASVGESRLQQQLEVGSTLLLALIVWISVNTLAVAPGLLLVVLYIFARVMPRLIHLYRLGQGLMTALPVIESLRTTEAECEAAIAPAPATQAPLSFTTDIVFEQVAFAYASRTDARPALRPTSLRIAAGETTAIIGASGSGKTTLADLLMGLLTPDAGRIVIDGVALTAATMGAWRDMVGYVPQDTFLFDDTIRVNMLWARPDASEQDIWEALQLAAADGFVSALPEGLDTVVGDRGVMLSGGERQRLAIARALIRRPKVLLLDEATSALDVESERRIKSAIDALHHRLTVIIITHRLSAIRGVDQVHVVDDGTIVASGSWDAVMTAVPDLERMVHPAESAVPSP